MTLNMSSFLLTLLLIMSPCAHVAMQTDLQESISPTSGDILQFEVISRNENETTCQCVAISARVIVGAYWMLNGEPYVNHEEMIDFQNSTYYSTTATIPNMDEMKVNCCLQFRQPNEDICHANIIGFEVTTTLSTIDTESTTSTESQESSSNSSENNSSVDELNESNLSMSVNYWLTIVFPSLIATLFVVTIIFIVIGVIVFLRRGRQDCYPVQKCDENV